MKKTEGRSPSYYTWRRFRRNTPAVAGLVFILLLSLIALLGYLLLPDPSPNANRQLVELKNQEPGTEVLLLKRRKNAELEAPGWLQTMFYGSEDPFFYIPVAGYTFNGDTIIVQRQTGLEGDYPEEKYWLPDVLFPIDVEAPFEQPNDAVAFRLVTGEKQVLPVEQLQQQVEAQALVQEEFLLGTDQFGRDLYSRLLLGARVSLSVGLVSVLISLLIGVVIGAVGGFFGGWVDDVVMWLINVWWSLPSLLLVIAFSFALGKGFWQVFVAVGLSMWVEVARIVRGQIIGLREKEYVEAAQALGFRSGRTIFRHVLPNTAGPVIVVCAANFAAAILLEAGLSFLGIGVQPPAPSWGYMIKENYMMIVFDAAYLAILPGLAISLTVLSFYLVGNGLRDALDVRG